MTAPPPVARTGGELVVAALERLGADVVFGLPGIHALPVWDALEASPIRVVGLRTELDAGFAADGYARLSGRPAPLLLSTGPGALNALTALMEAASAHVPVVAIASQIPLEFLGRGRGHLHELPDQLASFAPVVKHAARVETAEELAGALAEAWRVATEAPSGPVFVEIPADVLAGAAGGVSPVSASPRPPVVPAATDLDVAARTLTAADAPVIWAGGGVLRGEAWEELRAVAEQLDAPVVTTFMGKGAIADEHPLAVGSACNEPAVQRLLAEADAVLCVGSQLGADTTDDYRLRFAGSLIHLDADRARIGATYPALALIGDARATLRALLDRLPAEASAGRRGLQRAAEVADRVSTRLEAEEHGPELDLVQAIRDAWPTDAADVWDSTILGYWGASYFEARRPRRFLYPLGSGTIGYALPAAIGAAIALDGAPALAVVGDGGFQYAIAELAAARQHDLPVKLVLVDDGGYGILREYQLERYGRTTATDLDQPDFAAVCEGFGVPVRRASVETLGDDVAWAVGQPGPAAVVLRAGLACYRMT